MPITKELVREGLENGAIDGDGHSISKPKYYTERGFDPKDIQKLEVVHESGSGKHQIYQNGDMFSGVPVKEMKGVFSLDFHYWVAREVGLTHEDYGSFSGRGFQAQAIARALRKWVDDSEA